MWAQDVGSVFRLSSETVWPNFVEVGTGCRKVYICYFLSFLHCVFLNSRCVLFLFSTVFDFFALFPLCVFNRDCVWPNFVEVGTGCRKVYICWKRPFVKLAKFLNEASCHLRELTRILASRRLPWNPFRRTPDVQFGGG